MKEILIAHVEKFALLLCVLLMMWFLYDAFSMPPYDKTPDDFHQIAQRARNNVEQSKADISDLKMPDLGGIVASLDKEIDPAKIGFEKKWLRPFDFGLNFRREPEILKPGKPMVQVNRGLMKLFKTDINGKREEVPGGGGGVAGNANVKPLISQADIDRLREAGFEPEEAVFLGNEEIFKEIGGNVESIEEPVVAPNATLNRPNLANRNAFGPGVMKNNAAPPPDPKAPKGAAAAPAAKELVVDMVGKEWVEVVAPFPHADQIREYIKALREGAQSVGLRYARVEVERRELQSDMDWTEWESVPIKEQWEVIQNAVDWEAEPFPHVALKGLAMHIPFLANVDLDLLSSEEFDNPKPAEYTQEEIDPSLVKKAQPKRPRKKPPAAGAPKQNNVLVHDLQATRGGNGAPFDNRADVNTAMLRFWDFTVVPGRRYQYQVRVAVFNPNFNRKDVAESEFADAKYLKGPWSDPSDEVYVPPTQLWFVDDKQHSLRNRVDVEVQVWSREIGEWLVNSFLQGPGEIIGGIPAPPNQVQVWNSKTGQFEKKLRDFSRDFDTNQIILDVGGGSMQEEVNMPGNKLTKSFRMPREVFSVNAFGDLIRRNEDEDRGNEIRLHNEEKNQRMAGGAPANNANNNPDDGEVDLDPTRRRP